MHAVPRLREAAAHVPRVVPAAGVQRDRLAVHLRRLVLVGIEQVRDAPPAIPTRQWLLTSASVPTTKPYRLRSTDATPSPSNRLCEPYSRPHTAGLNDLPAYSRSPTPGAGRATPRDRPPTPAPRSRTMHRRVASRDARDRAPRRARSGCRTAARFSCSDADRRQAARTRGLAVGASDVSTVSNSGLPAPSVPTAPATACRRASSPPTRTACRSVPATSAPAPGCT